MTETIQCGSDNHDGGLADAVVIITPTNTAPPPPAASGAPNPS